MKNLIAYLAVMIPAKSKMAKSANLQIGAVVGLYMLIVLLAAGLFWNLLESQQLRADNTQLKSKLQTVKSQSTELKTEVEALKSEVQILKSGVEVLNTRLEKNDVEITEQKDFDTREVLNPGTASLSDLLKSGIRGPAGPPGVPGEIGLPGRDGRDAVNLAYVDRHINTSVSKAVSSEMKRIENVTKTIPTVSGATYIRHGRTSCPSHSQLIYQGRLGGTAWDSRGGSSQYICLPDDPEFSSLTDGGALSRIHGTEYEPIGENLFGKSFKSQNVPCAACQAGVRSNKIMIPAKLRCPDSSWTLEYKGFLMSSLSDDNYQSRTEYICVDVKSEAVPGMKADHHSAVLYTTTVDCPTVGYCPPYKTQREITCVVCSK